MVTKKLKAALTAGGLVVGGLTSYIIVNAALEGRRDEDVFQPHAKTGHYALDVFMAAVCAGVVFALASCQRKDGAANDREGLLGSRNNPANDVREGSHA